MEEKKKRGRPPLPPELRAKKKSGISATKEGGYAAQKKYRLAHPEKEKERYKREWEKRRETLYEPRLRIPLENRTMIEEICSSENLSLTQLFFSLVKEKYGIDLSSPVLNEETKSDKD